jgi:uncharacterized protein (PEP-CTERM system associated)
MRRAFLGATVLTALCQPWGARAAEWDPIARLTLGTILTDNVRLGGTGAVGGLGVAPTGNTQSDLIFTTNPTIGLRGQSGRTNVNVLYSPVIRGYLNESVPDTLVNNLNGRGTFEAVDNFLFIDANARITQTEISPFGGVANDPALINTNRTEARSIGLAPNIRGRFVDGGQYTVRHALQYTTFSQGAFSESLSNTTTANASGAPGRFVLPSVDYRHTTNDLAGTRVTTSDFIRARATFQVDGTLQPYVQAGYEDNRFRTSSVSGATYGAGLQWRPSPRTQFSALVEKRFFGTSYLVNGSHRMGLSSLSLRASRAEQLLPGVAGITTVQTDTRDLLDQALQSRIPDDALRAQEVERLVQQGGLPDTTGVPVSALSSRVTLVDTISPSIAVTRQRTTGTFGLLWSRSKALTESQIAGAPDAFATSNVIERQGFNLSVSHRMTPIVSLSGTMSYTETYAPTSVAGQPDRRTEQTIYRVSLSRSLTPRTSLSGSVRYQTFSSNTGPGFEERALIANLTHSFF